MNKLAMILALTIAATSAYAGNSMMNDLALANSPKASSQAYRALADYTTKEVQASITVVDGVRCSLLDTEVKGVPNCESL